MRNADENHHVGNAIRQIVHDFAAEAGLPGGDRNHAVEHVEPKPEITKKRRDDEQPTVAPDFQKQIAAIRAAMTDKYEIASG